MGSKPKLAVWKFTSCDGCQLSLLDCEDELLAVAGAVDIAYFPEATRRVVPGPYDVSLVEGSVSTPEEAERIRHIRETSGIVVAIGACATAGGIQALRNFADVAEMARCVYAHPDVLETLDACTPMDQHVTVDYELAGCPINPRQDGNPDGLVRIFQGHGSDDESVGRLFAGFAAGTEPFGSIVRRMGGGTDEEAL